MTHAIRAFGNVLTTKDFLIAPTWLTVSYHSRITPPPAFVCDPATLPTSLLFK